MQPLCRPFNSFTFYAHGADKHPEPKEIYWNFTEYILKQVLKGHGMAVIAKD